MKAGYDTTDSLLYGMPRRPDYIVLDNSEILHRVSFYPWHMRFLASSLLSNNTVAIFKIKPKNNPHG